jgi:WD40 repeat protein
MATEKEIEFWRRGLVSGLPVVGAWRRGAAVRALAEHREEPDAIRLLATAARSPFPDVALAAWDVLGDLRTAGAIDHLCRLWAKTRDDVLGAIIARRNYVASSPLDVKVLSSLKAGRAGFLDLSDPDVVECVAGALEERDDVLSAAAETALAGLSNQAAIDRLCRIVLEKPDGKLATFCAQAGYRPADPEQASLLLLVTCQFEELAGDDTQMRILANGYRTAGQRVRDSALTVLRLGDRRFSGFFSELLRDLNCTEEEFDLALELWMQRGEWERLMQACLELPLRRSLRAWKLLAASTWTPAGDLLPLFQEVVRELPQLDGEQSLAPIWLATNVPARPLGKPMLHGGCVWHAEFSPDGAYCVTAGEDGAARVWDGGAGAPVSPPIQTGDILLRARFSPDGELLATAGKNSARVWNWRTGEALTPPLDHGSRGWPGVWHVEFSPDGALLLTASENNLARVWDARTGQPVSPPLRHQYQLFHAAFSPDGSRVVTAGSDDVAHVWDARKGLPISGPLLHEDGVYHACFSPEGSRIVTASQDGTARIWDAQTGKPITPALVHRAEVRYAEFSPDGNWVLTASHDKTACLWDAATGKRLLPPLAHQGQVYHATFSPDGFRVLTASGDGSARLWDARTGEALVQPMLHRDTVWRAAFSPDGVRAITASSDRSARLWDVQIADVFGIRPGSATSRDLKLLETALQKETNLATTAAQRLLHAVLSRRELVPISDAESSDNETAGDESSNPSPAVSAAQPGSAALPLDDWARRLESSVDGIEYRIVIDVSELDPRMNESAFHYHCAGFNRFVLTPDGRCALYRPGSNQPEHSVGLSAVNLLDYPLNSGTRIFVHGAAARHVHGYFKTPAGVGLMVLASPRTNRGLLDLAAAAYRGIYDIYFNGPDFYRTAEIVAQHFTVVVLDPDGVFGGETSIGVSELLSRLS